MPQDSASGIAPGHTMNTGATRSRRCFSVALLCVLVSILSLVRADDRGWKHVPAHPKMGRRGTYPYVAASARLRVIQGPTKRKHSHDARATHGRHISPAMGPGFPHRTSTVTQTASYEAVLGRRPTGRSPRLDGLMFRCSDIGPARYTVPRIHVSTYQVLQTDGGAHWHDIAD